MDTKIRTIAKAVTWQILGLISMCALGFWQTGSIGGALTLAFSASLMSIGVYFLHERAWGRIRWGRSARA
ncbi:DUF2061 domain-containing protein [Oricola indica]|uniref:DUF2061 domain-containing protein n=1 Tax=Oricola indica TaxID=2872591 RepID=UPI003CCBDEE7